MAGVERRSGGSIPGWSTWRPEMDTGDPGGPYPPEVYVADPQDGGGWAPGGRPRGRGWHWPRPLGGTGALLVVTVVLIAAVAVVAAGSGHPRTARPDRVAAA